MKNVTGPICVNLSSRRRGGSTTAPSTEPSPRPIVRNIVFSGIRATVITQPINHPDIPFDVHTYPGETRQCIVVNGVGDEIIENVSFTDVQVTYVGGGTVEEAAVRDVPQIGGEYFQIGTPPAYGMYARNVRGLTLNNVRFEMQTPELRPAVVFDNVQDATVTNLAAQGNPQAESVLRFINARDVLLIGPRVLAPAAVFLQIEGSANEQIVIDGGNISKAAKSLVSAHGADEKAVTLRAI
jgi:hypothetical protein